MDGILGFIRRYKGFIKYAIVGATGTFVDVFSLYVFVTILGIHLYVSVVLSFLLAVINNFVLNKIWTFRNRSNKVRRQFAKFFIVSSIGLGLTLLCMYIMTDLMHIHYIVSKVITSLVVLSWNFLGNKHWTFRNKHQKAYEPMVEFGCDFSIIIPALNEANRIGNTLREIDRYIRGRKERFEVIVVDDGSTDGTAEVVKRGYPHFRVVSYGSNRGKGYAVKRGIQESRGRLVLFMDADSSTSIKELGKLERFIGNYDIVIGSRYIDESHVIVKQSKRRILLGRLGNFAIRSFLVDGIRDTQCGFKLFHANQAKEIVSFQKVERWGFDMEMLHIADRFGYTIKEVGVDWVNDGDSRMRPVKDAINTFKELLYIKFNSWFDGYKK